METILKAHIGKEVILMCAGDLVHNGRVSEVFKDCVLIAISGENKYVAFHDIKYFKFPIDK